MRKALAVALAVLSCPALAQAPAFQVGQHVKIGLNGKSGTIIAVGAALMNGGTMVRVHYDEWGSNFPDSGVWYDTMVSQIAADAAAAPAPAAP